MRGATKESFLRVFVARPTTEWNYSLAIEQTLTFDDIPIPSTTQYFEWSIRVVPLEVHNDDSLSLTIHFDEVLVKEQDQESLLSDVSGQSIDVRCFPWGELLMVDGYQELSGENVQWLDYVAGVIFPNPPRRSSQQWQNRILAWPFFLPQMNHTKQIVMANWEQSSSDTWSYQGSYYGKRGVTNFFDGSASGKIMATGPWVDYHSFNWERQITAPVQVTQTILGVLEKQ